MNEAVVVTLGPQRYALPIAQVREVLRWQPVTPLPKAPSFIEGVMNVRGRLIGVADLRARLDLKNTKRTDQARILLVRLPKALVGLAVDSVQGVIDVPPTSVKELQAALPVPLDCAFIAGLIRGENDIIVLLNCQALFSSAEEQQLAGIAPHRREVCGALGARQPRRRVSHDGDDELLVF